MEKKPLMFMLLLTKANLDLICPIMVYVSIIKRWNHHILRLTSYFKIVVITSIYMCIEILAISSM